MLAGAGKAQMEDSVSLISEDFQCKSNYPGSWNGGGSLVISEVLSKRGGGFIPSAHYAMNKLPDITLTDLHFFSIDAGLLICHTWTLTHLFFCKEPSIF